MFSVVGCVAVRHNRITKLEIMESFPYKFVFKNVVIFSIEIVCVLYVRVCECVVFSVA